MYNGEECSRQRNRKYEGSMSGVCLVCMRNPKEVFVNEVTNELGK